MKYLKSYNKFLSESKNESKEPEINKVINYPGIEPNENLPGILLIPGGSDGKIQKDYDKLAPILSKDFNVFTFYYNENIKGDGKKVASQISKQLKDKFGDKMFHILGYSMGTTFGFWIIKSLGSDFKGKFICLDAESPQADSPQQYVNNVLKHNTPRRYHCSIFWLDFNEVKTPTKEQQIDFYYSYKDNIQKKIEQKSKDINLEKCNKDCFIFNGQKKYENWRNSKDLVIEFIDEEGKIGTGEHYKSKMNPSGIWQKGKSIEIPSNKSKNVDEYIKMIMNSVGVEDEKQVWIVEDKLDYGWGGGSKEGKFYLDPNVDWENAINYLTNQKDGMVASMMRNPDDPEKLDDNIECLVIKAGKTNDGELNKKDIENKLKEDGSLPNNNTRVEVLKGINHEGIAENGASLVAKMTKEFINN